MGMVFSVKTIGFLGEYYWFFAIRCDEAGFNWCAECGILGANMWLFRYIDLVFLRNRQ